ncbi:hypothetical protein [Ewingella americana]
MNCIYNVMDVEDFKVAKSGQWFIGVFCTHPRGVFISPVNVFEEIGCKLDADIINNCSSQGMNRYASGAPGERQGTMAPFKTYKEGNWLANRIVGMTHHSAVMHKNKLPEPYSYGFSLIKINNSFVQIKFSSTSLNSKEGGYTSHSFSRGTYSNKKGFFPGTVLMPRNVQELLIVALRSSPFSIPHIARSQD